MVTGWRLKKKKKKKREKSSRIRGWNETIGSVIWLAGEVESKKVKKLPRQYRALTRDDPDISLADPAIQHSARNLNNEKEIELLRGTMLRRQLRGTDSHAFVFFALVYATRVNASRARAPTHLAILIHRVSLVCFRVYDTSIKRWNSRPTISFVTSTLLRKIVMFLLAS